MLRIKFLVFVYLRAHGFVQLRAYTLLDLSCPFVFLRKPFFKEWICGLLFGVAQDVIPELGPLSRRAEISGAGQRRSSVAAQVPNFQSFFLTCKLALARLNIETSFLNSAMSYSSGDMV